ncbi:hypothetical protein ACX27_26650 [Nostoc piscinale CENA21]|uniref:Phage tail collar domain-containing protein n=1 Tax=Nostoc piscinale CENA21 TaxID=224013 RepID=A0A0M4T0P4_9NOSO|nr:tail fiber protein [Nostoc piscinale]ALF55609.1 hypothetical protein ACX27_26650 [Nostoc piscinale CENA21]
MTRTVYQNGDVLTAEAVNAIGFPIPDGEDFIGRGPKVIDDYLDDAPTQIKSRFYGFYDRLRVSHNAGLTLNYIGGSVLLSTGVVVAITAGTITVPNNATSYIFVNSAGAIATAPTLPNESFPMAVVTTAGGTLSGSVVDLRDKLIDRVQPSTVPSSIQTGMGMEWWGSTLPSGGWLWQDGTEYDIATYPALDAVLGPTFRTTAGKFRVPDRRGRVGVGAGTGTGLTARTVGQTLGAETHQLNTTEMPTHGHGVSGDSHTHGITDNGHGHTPVDPGHLHSIYANTIDGDFNARGETDAFLSKNGVGITGEDTGAKGYITANASGNQLVGTSTTGITIATARTNIAINAASTGITISSQGGGAAHNNMQPSIVCNYVIKT